jgi:hypothetical protein
MFVLKYKEKHMFSGHNILTDGVFVNQLSSDTGILFYVHVTVHRDKYPYNKTN